MKCDYRGKLMHDRNGDFYLCNEQHSNGECECLPVDCPFRTDITFRTIEED